LALSQTALPDDLPNLWPVELVISGNVIPAQHRCNEAGKVTGNNESVSE